MSIARDVASLALSGSEVTALYTKGFYLTSDLELLSPIDLANETGLSLDITVKILQLAKLNDKPDTSMSAADLSTRQKKEKPIITFSKSIDCMLGGGIPIGQITEFTGVPGIGKTQIGIQIAVDAQIPECFGGCGGESIYIDTEGSFIAGRAAEIAVHVSKHLHNLSKSNKSEAMDASVLQTAAAQVTRDSLLNGIHVFRIHDQTELMALLYQLPAFIENNSKKIKVIVIDSIAFPFRQDLQELGARNRLLSSITQLLNQIEHDSKDTLGRSGSKIVPALGEHWSHCITNRVMLEWGPNNIRLATLVKSPSRPVETVQYDVKAAGIRDYSIKRPRSPEASQITVTQATGFKQ